MSSPKRFQKIREINVCHMYIKLDKKTKTYFMFEVDYLTTEGSNPDLLGH